MSLEKQDILQCYANRQVPNYLPTLITQNQSHFTQYSLKPEFIKANVFEIFQNIAGNNPDLSMLSKSISQLHENIKPEIINRDNSRTLFVRIGDDRQGPFDANQIMRFLKKSENTKNIFIENSTNGKSISGDVFIKRNKDTKHNKMDIKLQNNSKNGTNKFQNQDQQSLLNSYSEMDIKSEKSNFLQNSSNLNEKQKQDPFMVQFNLQQFFEGQNQGPQQNFNLGQTQNNCIYQLDQGLDFSLFGNQNYLQNEFQNSFSEDQEYGLNPAQQIIDSDEESISEESQKEFKPDGKNLDSLAFWNQYNRNIQQNQLSDISQDDEKTDQNDDSILQEIQRLQIGKQNNVSPKRQKKNSKRNDAYVQNGQNLKDGKPIKRKKKNRKNQQEQYPIPNQFQQGNYIYPNNTIQNLYAQQNNISIVGQFNQQQIISPQELAQLQQNFIMSQNGLLTQPQLSQKKNVKKKKKDASKYNPNLLQSQFQNNFTPQQYMSNQFLMNQNSSQMPQQQMQNYMSYYNKDQSGSGQYQNFFNGHYQTSQPPMMDQNGFQAYNHDFQNPQQSKKKCKKSKKAKQQNQAFDYQLGNYENGAYPNYFQNF